jgi:hypothetical protein
MILSDALNHFLVASLANEFVHEGKSNLKI